jgi:uncharacterized protein (TIGR00369 family)
MADDQQQRLKVVRGFTDGIPHNRALGMRVVELVRGADRDAFRGEAVFVLPYDAKLVGNPDTGVIHGGAITALIDACSGTSVFAALTEWTSIATLDLRIDYLRAAETGRDVIAKATCYRLSRNVAFTRAIAYHDDETDPIASSMGTFMLGTKSGGQGREGKS